MAKRLYYVQEDEHYDQHYCFIGVEALKKCFVFVTRFSAILVVFIFYFYDSIIVEHVLTYRWIL